MTILCFRLLHLCLIHMGRLGTLHEYQNSNYTIFFIENASVLHVPWYIE